MNIVEIKDFSFAYPRQEESLKNVTISIEEGSLNVLCGKSGCGKSTLLRQLKVSLLLMETKGEKSCTEENLLGKWMTEPRAVRSDM